MTYRELSCADLDLISEFHRTEFADGWNKAQLRSAFETGRFIALGAFDERLVGVITLSTSFDDADLEGVAVRREYRKTGVATRLLSAAQEKLKERGVKRLLLEVREGNIPAKNFYLKSGFEKISTRKNYYPDGENALVMVKEI